MFDKKIVIDGFPLEYYRNIEVSRELPQQMYSPFIREMEFDYTLPAQMKLTIETVDGISITCAPDFYEVSEDAIYIYGVLRKMFPSIFVDRELLLWQEDYLRDQGKYKFRARYFRNDPFFDTPEAKLFHSGYKHGKKRGEEIGLKNGREEGKQIGKLEAIAEMKQQQYNRKKRRNDRNTIY